MIQSYEVKYVYSQAFISFIIRLQLVSYFVRLILVTIEGRNEH